MIIRFDLLFPTLYGRTLAYIVIVVAFFSLGIDAFVTTGFWLTLSSGVVALIINTLESDDARDRLALKVATDLAKESADMARADALEEARQDVDAEIDAATDDLVDVLNRTRDAMQRGDLKAARWELERALEAV